MLAQLPADGPQAVEQLPPADGPRHAAPGGPEVLYPAQGAAVEQHPGLARLWRGAAHTERSLRRGPLVITSRHSDGMM